MRMINIGPHNFLKGKTSHTHYMLHAGLYEPLRDNLSVVYRGELFNTLILDKLIEMARQ